MRFLCFNKFFNTLLPKLPGHCRIVAALLPVCFPFMVVAETEGFLLTYQNQNRWAESGDDTGFGQFLTAAKEQKSAVYHVTLPENAETSRDLSLERLEVLATILENSLGHGVLLQEKTGAEPPATPANSLRLIIPK